MSMLARYKKSHKTLMELVRLIEESAEPKKTTLMTMVMQEDADFGYKVQRRLFNWEKFKLLDEGIVAEVISSCPAKILALALYQEEETFQKLAERCLGNKYSEYKSEKEIFEEKAPAESQIESARRKMISDARKMEADGAFKMMDYEKLDESGAVRATPVLGAGGASGSSQVGAEQGVPNIEVFQMQPPPAGLIGERLLVHVKKSLGIN